MTLSARPSLALKSMRCERLPWRSMNSQQQKSGRPSSSTTSRISFIPNKPTRIGVGHSEPLATGFTKKLNRGSTGKKTPGGAGTQHGTHGTHGRTRAHGSHGRTSQPSTQTQRHTRTTTRRGETATDSTFRYPRGQDLREPDPTPNRVRVVFLSCLGGFSIGYVS